MSGRARLPLWVVPHLQGLRLGTIKCTYTHTYLYRTCLTNTPSCFHFRHTLVSLPCPSTPLSPCSPPTFCWRASYFPSSFRGHLQGQSELPLSHRRRRCLCLWPPWPPCQARLYSPPMSRIQRSPATLTLCTPILTLQLMRPYRVQSCTRPSWLWAFPIASSSKLFF